MDPLSLPKKNCKACGQNLQYNSLEVIELGICRLSKGGVGSNAISAGVPGRQAGKPYEGNPMLDFLDTEVSLTGAWDV